MTQEKRVILIKPGDVLLIGGVQFSSVEEGSEAMRRFQGITGIQPVVFFADDIQIDALTTEQIGVLDAGSDVEKRTEHEIEWTRLDRERDGLYDVQGDARCSCTPDQQLADARVLARGLVHMEREHLGTGRDGHLSERDLAPLLHALHIDPEETP